MAKYPIKQSLRNIADIISKQVGQIDADLKTKSTAYNNLKGNLQSLEKKQTFVTFIYVKRVWGNSCTNLFYFFFL